MNEPDNTALLEREVAELLADEIEEPRPEFEAELRRRVREGFPRKRRRLPRIAHPKLALAGGLASAAIAVAVAVSLDTGEVTDLSAPAPTSREAAPSMVAPGPVPPSGDGGFEPGQAQRIERSADLTLAAPADELDRVADRIVALTDRHEGFILRSSVTSGDDEGTSGGNFELRVPASDLRPLLRELSGLGEVRSRTESGRDVTREFTSARERLDVARAERRSLLRRLERADTDAESEAIRGRLDLVAGQIRSFRSQLRDIRLRTDYVSVSVTLERSDAGDGGGGGAFSDTDDALRDGLDALAAVLNACLRVLGVLLPLGLAAAVAALGARALRRRRREAVLS